jgi:prepilin-type N-terminal cleavage/methylation domain-containing protein
MKGYSLIELMIVLAILAIGLVFAVPSLQHMRGSMKAETHVNYLLRAINLSRVLAISKNQVVMLCPQTQKQEECGNDWQQGLNIYLMDKNQQRLYQVIDGFEGADLSWNRNSQKIVFAPDGSLKSQNGSFIYHPVTKPEKTKRLILSSTGRARVE